MEVIFMNLVSEKRMFCFVFIFMWFLSVNIELLIKFFNYMILYDLIFEVCFFFFK